MLNRRPRSTGRSYVHGKRDHAGMGNVRLLRWTSDREPADAQPQPTHDALSAITARPAGGSTGPLRLARAAAAIGAIAFAVLPCHVALSQWRQSRRQPGSRPSCALPRFLRLPTDVEVLVCEQHGRDELGQLQHVHGEQHHLDRHALAAGVVELSDALARWWVLDNDHRARRREATLWASTGHAAAVHGDELYDALPQTRGGYGRLQDFGIRFGYERVVLHVHPQVHAGRLECNTARTLLLLDHEPLPWARWGEEFTAAMPDDIRQLQERAANADCVPRREAIRGRISAIMPLYRLSRYRPTQSPQQSSTGSGVNSARAGDEPAGRTSTRIQARSTPPAASSVHALADAASARDRSGSEPASEHADRRPGSDAL